MSKIQWTTTTWNPIVGCSIPTLPSTGKARRGCANCYACKDSPHRFPAVYDREGVVVLRGKAKKPGLTWVPRTPEGKSLGKGAQWTGEVRLLPWVLEKPIRRKKPTTYFVNSLSDLFHESLVDCEEGRRYIAAIAGVVAACPQHTFQWLTKRPHKAREWFAWLAAAARSDGDSVGGFHSAEVVWAEASKRCPEHADRIAAAIGPRRGIWPLPNLHLGTSVEDQASADWAIPELLKVPAAMRWISAEPLLGPIDLNPAFCQHCGRMDDDETPDGRPWCVECEAEMCFGRLDDLDWVVVGGESGPGARPCEVAWIRAVVEQCKAAEVPCFTKQLGARPLARREKDLSEEQIRIWDAMDDPPRLAEGYFPRLDNAKGGNPSEWPEDLRVRELPCTS